MSAGSATTRLTLAGYAGTHLHLVEHAGEAGAGLTRQVQHAFLWDARARSQEHIERFQRRVAAHQAGLPQRSLARELEGRIAGHHGVATRALGHVEALVGALEELLASPATAGLIGGGHAQAHVHAHPDGGLYGVGHHLVAHAPRHRLGHVVGGAGQHQQELVAAVAEELIARAQHAAGALGHGSQGGVAGGVPVHVVEGLEVVHVEHGQRVMRTVTRSLEGQFVEQVVQTRS